MLRARRPSSLVIYGVAVLSGLLLSEGALRVLYRQPWYERLLEGQRATSRMQYTKNALGMRDRDYPVAKPESVRRIMILGSSFAFGSWVADDRATLPELLEQSLNQHIPIRSVDGIEVLNAAIQGGFPRDWYARLGGTFDSFRPDVVLVVFTVRDGTEASADLNFFDPIRNEIAVANRASRLYQMSYIYRVARDAWDRVRIFANYSQALNRYYTADAPAWKAAQESLLAIQRFAQQRSAIVGLVIFPYLVELNARRHPFQPAFDAISAFCRESKVPVYDLLPAFHDYRGPELWVSGQDQHPNEIAYRVAAAAVEPFVKDLLIEAERGRHTDQSSPSH